MASNYYIILGVDSNATQDQIRSAYRRKAKQLHPDHCEGSSSKPFRDVQEAYETLSDPGRRQTYDNDLAEAGRSRAPLRGARAEPLRSRECPVEPLIPTERSIGLGATWSRRYSRPSVGETVGWLWDNLESPDWSGAARSEELQVTVSLTREQALRGGRVRVWVPVQATCPDCWGHGRVGLYACQGCSGQGALVEQRPVWIVFPGGVTHGSAARLPLAQLGAPDSYLTIRFDVHGW